MKLEELPDDFTHEQFMQLDAEAMNQLSYTVHKLSCGVKNCKRTTQIRDYGIQPFYLLSRNSKYFIKNPEKYWWDLSDRFMLCHKHYPFYQKLITRFGIKHVHAKLLRPYNQISEAIKSVNQSIEKINAFG